MDRSMRYLLIGGSMLALPSLLVLGKFARHRRRKCPGEFSDNGMYEKLRESKTALDKASSAIQSTLDDMERENSRKDG